VPWRGQVRLHLPALPSLKRVLLPRPLAATLRAPQRYYAGCDSSPARTRRRGLSASFALPSEHPDPNHGMGPEHHHLIHVGVPGRVLRPKLRHGPAGSSSPCRRNGFVIPGLRRGRLYGLLVRLRLLATPPRGDAVAFDYMWRDLTWVGLSPPDKATSQTHTSRIASPPARLPGWRVQPWRRRATVGGKSASARSCGMDPAPKRQ
jgi:hypothetical protein